MPRISLVPRVDIGTDCRMPMSGAMRKCAREHAEAFDPRKLILAAMMALEILVRDRYERSGTAVRGASIRVIALPGMAQRCEEGVLDPRVAAA